MVCETERQMYPFADRSTREVAAPPTLDALLRTLAGRGELFCMDLGERYTVLGWPEAERIVWSLGEPSPLDRLCASLAPRRSPGGRLPLPGGWVGWLGYEAGALFETCPPPRSARPLPDLCLWRVEGALVLEQPTGRLHLHGGAAFLEQAAALVDEARRRVPAASPAPREAPPPPPPGAREAYLAAVREALDRIAEGWIYQVNLAWELRGPATPDPIGAWLALRARNPARMGALLRWGPAWILSNSPETALRTRGGRRGLDAWSLPIKGTASRRVADPQTSRRALVEHEKERAELTMIVDLVRNDLGRVARPGGVHAGHRRIRACGDLWHAEQAVTARLRAGMQPLDALAATFPPGSVTGAPKVEAMRRIQALEAGPRGIYTGSLVSIGDDGASWANVAIRTATLLDGEARMHVGAGIVADSRPEAEWEETLAKARALACHVMAP